MSVEIVRLCANSELSCRVGRVLRSPSVARVRCYYYTIMALNHSIKGGTVNNVFVEALNKNFPAYTNF